MKRFFALTTLILAVLLTTSCATTATTLTKVSPYRNTYDTYDLKVLNNIKNQKVVNIVAVTTDGLPGQQTYRLLREKGVQQINSNTWEVSTLHEENELSKAEAMNKAEKQTEEVLESVKDSDSLFVYLGINKVYKNLSIGEKNKSKFFNDFLTTFPREAYYLTIVLDRKSAQLQYSITQNSELLWKYYMELAEIRDNSDDDATWAEKLDRNKTRIEYFSYLLERDDLATRIMLTQYLSQKELRSLIEATNMSSRIIYGIENPDGTRVLENRYEKSDDVILFKK